jgi:hypothetical protein
VLCVSSATGPDPYAGWSLSDRLQLLAFEAELAKLPRGLIAALWDAIDRVRKSPCVIAEGSA